MDSSSMWYYQDPSTGSTFALNRDDLISMFRRGVLPINTMIWSQSLAGWERATDVAEFQSVFGVSPPLPPSVRKDADLLVNRIADYYKASAICWLFIAIIQIISIFGIIAGIWNVFASVSRFKMINAVRLRHPFVVEANKGVTQLVILGVVNIILGAVVGVLFVAFDFYIRDQVLKNAVLFGGNPAVFPSRDDAQTQSISLQIDKLLQLRQRNVITDEEYNILKNRILKS